MGVFVDEHVQRANQQVSNGDRHRIETHNQGLHRFRRLFVRQFQRGNGNENLGYGNNNVRQNLPRLVERNNVALPVIFKKQRERRCNRANNQTEFDFSDKRQVDKLVNKRINRDRKERNQPQNQSGIERLHLVGKDFELPNAVWEDRTLIENSRVHAGALLDPAGAGLIVHRPKRDKEQINQQNLSNSLQPFLAFDFFEEVIGRDGSLGVLLSAEPKD